MPLIQSRLGFLGFGASKEEAITASGSALEMWKLAQSKFEGVKVYLESGYESFLNARTSKAQDLVLKATKSSVGVSFFGQMVEEATTSLAIAKAVVEQLKQVNDNVLAGRPPLRGSVKVPSITGEDEAVISPGAALAIALAGGALILFAVYKGANRFRSR